MTSTPDPPHIPAGELAPALDAISELAAGRYSITLPTTGSPSVDALHGALQTLADTLAAREVEVQKLDAIVTQINEGLQLSDVLDNVYEEFRSIIPFNRIGLSLIEDDGKSVRAHWARTDQAVIALEQDYHAPLAGSSLQQIIDTGEPRILNDLETYSREHPASESTRLIVMEGIRASLTCPLIVEGNPVGFIFFSSTRPNTYTDEHIRLFKQIASHLALAVEKALLVAELEAQKTEIERHNQTLMALNTDLHRVNELKNTFVGIAAHDLRSPIAYLDTVASTINAAGMDVPPEQIRQFFLEARRQTGYMLELINGLLDVSQIESGELALNVEPVDLPQLVQQAAERHQIMALNKRINIVVEAGPTEPLSADAVRLRQAIDNLLSNAVKYSNEGSTVRVRATIRGGQAQIEVEDDGPGIDPKEQSRLFEYFGRLSSRPTGGEKSIGLGLAISRRIMEAHGGRIEVESEPGEGAIFRLVLPT